MGKRIDGSDTVDNATHLLHRLQADGWVVKDAGVQFGYGTVGNKVNAKIPVQATVTIELVPGFGS